MSEQALKEFNEARELMSHPQTIELDCEPGMTRPDDLIGGVVKGTILEPLTGDPAAKFFGNYTWVYKDVPTEEWAKVKSVIGERVKALYNAGRIRYGSW